MRITIGIQAGCVKCEGYVAPLHEHLSDNFDEYIKGAYFKNIEELYIAFRVSGEVHDFESEGPERMRYMRKKGYISIDLVVPESSWNGVHPREVHNLIIEGVETCLKMMIDRAEKEKECLDREALERDIKKAIDVCRDYESLDYGDLPNHYHDIPDDPRFS